MSKIVIDTTTITAEVYRVTDKGMYLVKVSIPSIGEYMDGWTARPSPNYPEKGLWIQSPARPAGRGHYKSNPEFDKHMELWQVLEEAVKHAVEAFRHENVIVEDVEDMTQEQLRKELDEAFPD